MSAAYDSFDYPSYWVGREYEHASEIIALNALFAKIPKIDRLIEIGGGYGRIVPTYLYRTKKIVFSDPSSKLLKIARANYSNTNIKFIHSKLEKLRGKVKTKSFDTVVCIRVLHHIKTVDDVFEATSSFLKKGGYFVLEYPNKRHFKAVISELVHGNITFSSDIFPKDLSIDDKDTLPFVNYHPDEIKLKLKMHGFDIVAERSVSNIRNSFIKTHIPLDFLVWIENLMQAPFARIYFGPSVFVLARKR